MTSWAKNLVGQSLEGGWRVLFEVPIPTSATGGLSSVGYIVEGPTSERAFLKAIDFAEAMMSADPARALQRITVVYNYERDLCKRCRDRRLTRVIHAIGDGKVLAEPANPGSIVQYLIFELADGDIRTQLDSKHLFDLPWIIRTLHHVATGLMQLHGVGVAHQDLKPSNVLVLPDSSSKLGDLGRATERNIPSPFDDLVVPGDKGYAPLELLYSYSDPDWNRRRLGGDAYLLGSLAVFLFLRTGMTSLIMSELAEPYRWWSWAGSYADVMDFVRDAFGRAMKRFDSELPACLRPELTPAIRQLCEPAPQLRGHPMNRQGHHNQLSLERYVSLFDRLATKLRIGNL